MMKSWFNCRVKYVKLSDSGREEKVTEQYVLDAHNYTEAETRITQRMMQQVSGMFQIVNITKANYTEVIRFDDAEKWFRVKVSMVSYDDESSKEKTTNQYFLMTANDVRDAYDKTDEFMRGSIAGHVIPSINYTPVVEVYPLSEENREEMEARAAGFKPISEMVHPFATPTPEPEEPKEEMVDPESGEIIQS